MSATKTQESLPFDDPMGGAFRRSDPISSVAAGRSCNAEGERARIVACLAVSWHPMTVREIVKSTGIPRDHVASRLPVMERRGQVLRAGFRDNEHGHPVQLWSYKHQPRQVTVQVTGDRL